MHKRRRAKCVGNDKPGQFRYCRCNTKAQFFLSGKKQKIKDEKRQKPREEVSKIAASEGKYIMVNTKKNEREREREGMGM